MFLNPTLLVESVISSFLISSKHFLIKSTSIVHDGLNKNLKFKHHLKVIKSYFTKALLLNKYIFITDTTQKETITLITLAYIQK